MQKVLLQLFLLAVVSAIITEAALVPRSKVNEFHRERKGFRLLGTLKKSRIVMQYGLTSAIYEDWDYWESSNSAGWAEAKRDCEANGDTILYIETREEVGNVTRWLEETDNSGSLYWVGGKYDVRSEGFIWDNNVPFSPEAPWGDGQPRDKKPNTRVAISTVGRVIELKTQVNTLATRYICESKRVDGDHEQIPEPCFKDNDLAIVVDSSGSIQDPHYIIAKEFTARLTTTWVDHPGSRVAVQIFSNTATSIFGLTDPQDVTSIRDKVYNMPHIKSDTRSHLGLQLAISEIEANARAVFKNIVFITDGGTNPPSFKPDTKAAAERANSLGIRTFSVGIGNIDQEELLSIAGGNADHVFLATQFEELLALLRPLSLKVCE